MKKNLKMVLVLFLIIIAVLLIWLNSGKENRRVVRVGGWDMEYMISDRKLVLENFENIELGSSLNEIEDKFGEPDGWVGAGILWPVYVLEDNSAIELVFGDSTVYEDLEAVYLYRGETESMLKKKMIINVEGFEVEYNSTDSNFVLEVFDDIKLGSSMREISDELGEPDAWIGSGMMRPVYFLEDDRVVVLHFEYPAACDKLKQIVLIEENGESKVLKEK